MTRVVVTADFHGRLPSPSEIPPCDLLLIAGDFAGISADWLLRLPADEIVAVAGNHDWDAQNDPEPFRRLPWTYLEDESATVAGLKVWGSPFSMPFHNWAFMAPEHELEKKWATIPDDTEILVVHGPAHLLLDRAQRNVDTGSQTLKKRLGELLRLKLFACGHIHECYGQTGMMRADGSFLPVVNGSYVDERYRPGNPPIVVDL